jgi:hypothetical protein
MGICDIQSDAYKYVKYILWCYCPRDDEYVTCVSNMIQTLDEEANVLRHVAKMLQLAPHLPLTYIQSLLISYYKI